MRTGDTEGEEAVTSRCLYGNRGSLPLGTAERSPQAPHQRGEKLSHWLHSDSSDADCPALPWGKPQQPEEASRKGHRGRHRLA